MILDIFQQLHFYRVEWIVVMEDLHQSFYFIPSILSIIVDKELPNDQLPNVMDVRFGRSNHYPSIQYHINTSDHKGTIIEIA